MQVSVETTSNLGRCMTVKVPPDQFENEFKIRLREYGKNAKIEGFRPDKVPPKILEQRFGVAAYREALNRVVQTSLNTALHQEKLQPAGSPKIEFIKEEKGQPLEYKATFEILPEITLNDMTDVALENLTVNLTDADVDHVLEQMRKQHADWVPVERAAELGDRLNLDFKWPAPDSPGEFHEEKNVSLVLESQANTPPEMIVLRGTKVGDEVEVPLTLKSKITQEETKVTAKAKVLKITEPKLPELNQEFADRLEVTGGIAGLRQEVKQHMEQQVKQVAKSKLRNQVVEQLLKHHTVELPAELVEKEGQQIEQEHRSNQKAAGILVNEIPNELKEEIVAMAKDRVKLSLLYAAIIKKNGLKVDANRVRERLEQMVGMYQDSAGMVERMMQDQNTMYQISSQIMEEQVIEKVMEQIKLSDKAVSYNEIMEIGRTTGHGVGGMGHDVDCHEHDHSHCDHDH